ncbi:MAG: tripartite tricarboxylate transporter substrate binding protein [Pseudomonadota bacterium]
MRIRPLLVVAVAVWALLPYGPAFCATDYPTKSVRLVVPFPPGGASDLAGRIMAQVLGKQLGATIFVDNRPGAGGTVGSEQAVRSPADGYTLLLMAAGPITVGPSIFPSYPFDVERDLAPVAIIATIPNIVTIHPSVPATDLAGFIAYARQHPDEIDYASSGNGSLAHLSGELLKQLTGIRMTHVPYRGTGPALADLVAGQVKLLIDNMPPAMPFVRAGSLRALAVTGQARSPAAPDLPTAVEAGLPGYVVESWTGLAAPGGTPEPIITRLYEAMRAGLQDNEVRQQLGSLGAQVDIRSPQDSRRVIAADTERWRQLIASAHIRVD